MTLETRDLGDKETMAAFSILCVDDEPNILSALRRLFRGQGFKVHIAEGGKAGLEVLATQQIDLVISDMRMPEMDGAQFLEQVKLRWPGTVRLLLTGYADISSTIGAINRGEIYRYITKPWDDTDISLIVRQALERHALALEKARLEALTQQQNEALQVLNASLETKVSERTAELKVANDKLRDSFITSIKVFSTLIEMRGGNLAGHSRRVADLCRKIAQKLGMDSKQVQEMFVAGLLHEIGKVGFADELLNTPVAMMTPEQLEAYRKHSLNAEQLLMPLPDLQKSAEYICAQFERFDGSGFPGHLAGEDIPLGARILVLASDYDNMQIGTLTQRRLTAEESKIIIIHGSGKRYDPRVVEAFKEILWPTVPKPEPEKSPYDELAALSPALTSGMVLARDLITPNGLLMLSAKHVLDQRLIDKIVDYERSTGMELTAYIRVPKGYVPPPVKIPTDDDATAI